MCGKPMAGSSRDGARNVRALCFIQSYGLLNGAFMQIYSSSESAKEARARRAAKRAGFIARKAAGAREVVKTTAELC